MPRAVRDTRLETRTARLKLPVNRHPYKRSIEQGLILLYYRGKRRGSWSVRIYDSKAGKYREHRLGLADDHRDADNAEVLDFSQAQARAKEKAAKRPTGARQNYTVQDAVDDYLEWFQAHRKSYRDVKNRMERHVLPKFSDQKVEDLDREQIEKWHRGLAHSKAQLRSPKTGKKNYREDSDPRARKVTANRALSYFKAALNRAHRTGKVTCDPVWNTVEPFKGVETERVVFLSQKEAKRLINATDKEFRPMVQTALYTGCRFSEIAELRVSDFYPDDGQIFVHTSKSGRPRYVPLSSEGLAFFKDATAGKKPDEYIFLRSDGMPWKQGHYNKRFIEARKKAKITDKATFHSLRHTYASYLINEGVPLKVISDLLGHHSITVTERYYAHLADSVKKQAVELYLPSYGRKRKSKVVSM